MKPVIGIRREDKNKWERRVPLIPEDLADFISQGVLECLVQPSGIRVFPDQDYIRAGAQIEEDLSPCKVVFGVKEFPLDFIKPHGTYMFFSHVIKGQEYNMHSLQKLLDQKCQLIDYEAVVNEKNQRLIFFGSHAGRAGMIETLCAFGKRLAWENIPNAFSRIQHAYQYESLEKAKEAISSVGQQITAEGLPEDLVPVVCGFAGYGHVAKGAQEIFDILPVEMIDPPDLERFFSRGEFSRHIVYKSVFKEEHMAEPNIEGTAFQLQDYYDHPEKYRGIFKRFLPYLSILMNCIYWNERYPRLMTKEDARAMYGSNHARLKVIGDISCDINGAIEFTEKVTTPSEPTFVYDFEKDRIIDGWQGKGPVVMAVDNLPCELPRESSVDFSRILKPFVGHLARADFTVPFDALKLPPEIKRAIIVYQGELTENYKYLENHL